MIKEPIKILLIEDNPGDVYLLKLTLAESTTMLFQLETTDHFRLALSMLKNKTFDIILLDLSLPDAWGIDMIQKMQQQVPNIPVVVLTNTRDDMLAIKAVQMGAQDYLVKGDVNSQILVRTIRHAIERHRLVKDLEHQMNAFLNSEARLHNMIEHNADGIVIVGKDHRIRFVNPAAESLFNRSNNELIDTPFDFPIEINDTTEITIIRPQANASQVTAEMRVVETTWDEQGAYLATLRDITERKQTEEELHQYREHLENLVQERTVRLEEALTDVVRAHDQIDAILYSIADGLIVTDLEYRVILTNPAAEAMFDLQLDVILGHEADAEHRYMWLHDLVQNALTYRINNAEIDIKIEDAKQGALKIFHAQTTLVDNRQGELIGTATVIRDVTRLREVDRLKTEFLTMAAHELRTPLTSILGFSEILSQRDLDENRLHRYMTMINDQATHLKEIINNLLDIARLEAGRGLELNLEPIDLAPLLRNLVQPFQETNKQHHIDIEGPEALPLIMGDNTRLRQVGKNLLSNAIKYSPNGGKITVYGEANHHNIKISICDEGIGMTQEQQQHLFEQFYRADASNTAIGGTGLGLTISKLIVNLHGGDIWIESESGIGTKVHITLPLLENC